MRIGIVVFECIQAEIEGLVEFVLGELGGVILGADIGRTLDDGSEECKGLFEAVFIPVAEYGLVLFSDLFECA